MSGIRVPALLTVLSGQFPNQLLAFSALQDAADSLRLSFDLLDVDVIREASEVRLAHYFRPRIVARIREKQADDDTAFVLRLSILTAEPRFPPDGGKLRLLGKFAGTLVEPREFRL